MNSLKPILIKRSGKQGRTFKVLLGLVDHYLKTGRPVGSKSLSEAGFEDLSSATIRNYFNYLEQEGYLTQQHSSGGRIPTHKAYRFYAQEYINSPISDPQFQELRLTETKEIAAFLQESVEQLSAYTQTAVFITAPRFDQDFISAIKIVPIDHARCLCVIITDFGLIKTETIHLNQRLSAFSAKRLESYFRWRLTGLEQPDNFDSTEEEIAKKIYNELIVRYVVGYSNFIDSELYRTGFSRLLNYSEFHDPTALASGLALFENPHQLQLLAKECCKANHLKLWIGDELSSYSNPVDCSMILIPYYINQNIAGAVGLLGPTRLPYRELFAALRGFSFSISEALTRNLYKFKITFRQPHHGAPSLIAQTEQREIERSGLMLLENKGD